MSRMSLTDAAELIAAAYVAPGVEPSFKNRIKDTCPHIHAQAYLLTDNTLVIPGSNSLGDYLQYNFRMLGIGRPRLTTTFSKTGARVTWHQGFLAHAKAIQDWLLEKEHKRVSFIIGHSLGAASAQVLSAGYGIPAIAFAAPRTCNTANPKAAAPKCLCVNRADDTVTELPTSMQHMGVVKTHTPAAPNRGIDHNMDQYKKAIRDGVPRNHFPRQWPSRH